MAGFGDTVKNARDTVGGAVSYITNGTDELIAVKNGVTDTIGNLTSPIGLSLGNKAASSGSGGAGTIPQSERLLTVRPRSTPLDNKNKYTADRGPYASIKLLTDKSQSEVLSAISTANAATSGQGLDSVATSLLSDGGYTDFLLTNIDVAFNEKIQVNEVFGDSEVVYYFGRSPVQFNFSGLLVDDVDNNWFYRFMVAYWGILRGTQMAKNHQLAQINLPNMTIVGTITGISYQQEASRDTDIRFNMQFLAKSIVPRPVLLPSEMLNNNALLLNLKQADLPARFQDTAMINNIKRSVSSAQAYLGSTLGAASSAFSEGIEGFGATVSNAIGSAKAFFDDSVGGFLSVASLRANLIAPVYGVLTTLTKVVKSITGQVLSLFSSGSSLLGTVLADVKAITNEAMSLVNAIEGGINDIVSQFEKGANDLRRTIQAIKNAAGAIANSPENISNILKRLSKTGGKKGYIASLKSGRVSKAHIALINSGSAYKSGSGATLSG